MTAPSNQPRRVRISHSQINTYLSCAQKWSLQYNMGLRVRTEEVAPATLGDVVHVGLAGGLQYYYIYQETGVSYSELQRAINTAIGNWDAEHRPADKTSLQFVGDGNQVGLVADDEFYQSWDDMVFSAKQIALRTLQNLQLIEQYDVVELDGSPLVEYWLAEDVPGTPFEFAGKVDAVLYNRTTGLTEVIDWKVRGKFSGVEAEQLNSQIGLYQHVLQQRGINAQVGVVYQIKNEAPRQPKLNKDGSMSRQRIISDWPTYEVALLGAGLDPADYEDMQEKLADVEFFRPLMVVRTPAITAVLWDNLIEQAQRIQAAQSYPRSYGYPCRFCQFSTWCQAELYGYDTEDLLLTQYEIVERVSEVEEEQEGEHA